MEPFHVCYLAGQLGLGGAEKQLYILIKGLVEQNFAITVFDFYPQQNGYWRGELQKLGVDLISYESQSKLDRIPRLINDLRRIQPLVVHGWSFHTNPYANFCGRVAKVPVRVGCVREHPNYWPDSKILQLTSIYGLDGLIFNSSTAYSFYRDYMKWPLKSYLPKSYVVKNGIETLVNEDKDELTKELETAGIFLPSNRNIFKIVGIGRLNENKNWSLLIKSCKHLSEHGKDYLTIIIGDGPEKENLLKQIITANLQGKVILTGSIPHASKFLPIFDLLCSCSYSEGMPNTIMEASLAGLPVLATKVGGIEEIVDNYKTGILVESDNLDEFQQKLLYLADNKEVCLSMGTDGKARTESHFAGGLMVSRMIKVYYELISKMGR